MWCDGNATRELTLKRLNLPQWNDGLIRCSQGDGRSIKNTILATERVVGRTGVNPAQEYLRDSVTRRISCRHVKSTKITVHVARELAHESHAGAIHGVNGHLSH